MKEIITLNFGQTGINIAESTLQLYLREHSVRDDAHPSKGGSTLVDSKYNPVFFESDSKDRLSYRSISVDCDPFSSNEALSGVNRVYYKKERMVNSKQSSSGVYSRGYAIANKQLCEEVEHTLQRTLENCDNLQGIMVNVSLLGGASGIYHQTMGKIMGEEYLKKKIAVSNIVFPSKNYSNSIIDIYNYTLAFRTLLQFSHLNIPYDNQSLYSMCEESGVQNPGYVQINKLIANMQSSITLPFRSQGPLNNNLNSLVTNLVCYPRINLTYPSSTLMNPYLSRMYNISVDSLLNSIMDPRSRMIEMHSVSNKIAVALYFRGEIIPYDVVKSLKNIRESKNCNCVFEQWSPLGFKVGINQQKRLPYYGNHSINQMISTRSCCSLTSSMEFNSLLGFNNYKFDRLFAKRIFVHSFIQDMTQEYEFSEAREDLAALQKDYQSWGGCTEEQQQE